MKTFALLCLAATAVAFDGSGSITSDADLAAMLSGDNAAHADVDPTDGVRGKKTSNQPKTALDGGFKRPGVFATYY